MTNKAIDRMTNEKLIQAIRERDEREKKMKDYRMETVEPQLCQMCNKRVARVKITWADDMTALQFICEYCAEHYLKNPLAQDIINRYWAIYMDPRPYLEDAHLDTEDCLVDGS